MHRLLFISLLLFVSCTQSNRTLDKQKTYTFLALGDSYTIGESVSEEERWPAQLSERLLKDSIHLAPTWVAQTGWTTNELMDGMVKAEIKGTYDLVSLLIGVNNQYRGYEEDQYEKEFKVLLDKAVKLAGGNNHHVLVVSIPDYGTTPFAKEKGLDATKIGTELDSYNAIAQKIAVLRDVAFVDITVQSRAVAGDASYLAPDGLHPSGKMYAAWVDLMYDQVYGNLSSR